MKKVMLVLAVMTVAIGGCATKPQTTLHTPWQTKAKPIQVKASESILVFRFNITTLKATELKGIPFYVRCQIPDQNQGFLLCCRRGNEWLPNIAVGYLDEDGIVWTNWLLEPLVTKPGETLTLELSTIGGDEIGIIEVLVLGESLLTADDSELKNPPE